MESGKMNPKLKQKWVEALRSGEYNQTRGILKDDNGYCCLGVLTDVVAKEQNVTFDHYFNKSVASLCDDVREICNLNMFPSVRYSSASPTLIPHEPLTYLNDVKKLNFIQLADLIEEQL